MLCSFLICSSNDTVLLSNLSLSNPEKRAEKTITIITITVQHYYYNLLCCVSSYSISFNIFNQQAELTADEASGLQDLLLALFLTPQVSERVNDHTEDEVQNNNNDDEEEQQVVHHTSSKHGFL